MPSYGSDAGLIAYLDATGRELPVDAEPAIVRHYGTLYVDSFEDMYRGTRLAEENSFPRDLWPVVPTNVEHAAYEAGYAYATGVPIFGGGGTSGGQVIREKVDVLEVQYAEPTGDWWEFNRYILPLAYALLLPFFKVKKDDKCCSGGGGAFVV